MDLWDGVIFMRYIFQGEVSWFLLIIFKWFNKKFLNICVYERYFISIYFMFHLYIYVYIYMKEREKYKCGKILTIDESS